MSAPSLRDAKRRRAARRAMPGGDGSIAGDARRAYPLEPAHKPAFLRNDDVPGMVQAIGIKKDGRMGGVENFRRSEWDAKFKGGR